MTGLLVLHRHTGYEEVGRGQAMEYHLCLIKRQWGAIEEFRVVVYQNHIRIESKAKDR